jgi:hypothetical protein
MRVRLEPQDAKSFTHFSADSIPARSDSLLAFIPASREGLGASTGTKRNKILRSTSAIAALAMSLVAGSAHADSPLELQYAVTAGASGQYDYDFTLKLDNHTGSWSAGQGWSWITFGDAADTTSPLADFAMTSAAPAPFSTLNFSGGGHNGPTFLIGDAGFVYWTPSAVGDELTWTGTSSVDLAQGQLLFSTLAPQGGAAVADFQVADLVSSPVPEGDAPTMLAAGLGLLAIVARRRARQH